MILPWHIALLVVWNIFGGLALCIIWTNRYRPFDKTSLLSPIWIYEEFEVNIIGCMFLTILFNMLCPIFSIFYWFIKLIHFIFTVGR